MVPLADHDMVVNGDTEGSARFGQRLRHVHVRAGGGRITRRVVVRQNNGSRVVVQCTLNDFAWIDRDVIYCPCLVYFVGHGVTCSRS